MTEKSPAAGNVPDWMPIESAPKDGREVLLFLGAPWSKIEKARWYAPWANWQAGVIPSDPVREERHGIGAAIPTHWLPLPPAPGASPPSPEAAREPNEDYVLALARKHLDKKAVYAITYTSSKDGIDIERASTGLMEFAKALAPSPPSAPDDLIGALRAILEHYVSLANCGDCGNWDPEKEEQVETARAMLAKYRPTQVKED